MSTKTKHNLPDRPYKKFFGREDSIRDIETTLLEGRTYIANIDGVGGIGKTALAYHFCEEKIVKADEVIFDYLVWISSKITKFDPLTNQPLPIGTDFQGIETLFDTLLSVCGLEEEIEKPLECKRLFCEKEILETEPVFFVLDNLENVEDGEFFEYILKDFNRISGKNKKILKVLTTSRKRGQIADFPVRIEGLGMKDALSMLEYHAKTYSVADISNAPDPNNVALVEKVGGIPLGIEFIVRQMANGRSRGDIIRELEGEGYPELNDDMDDDQKEERLSEIIRFSFKDMYETLDEDSQYIFKTVAVLQKNRHQSDPEITLELLMAITSFAKTRTDRALENLIVNNLLDRSYNNSYQISQMAINFASQHYEDFEKVEEEVIGKFRSLVNPIQRIEGEFFLQSSRRHSDKREYAEAKKCLQDGLSMFPNNYHLHYELGKTEMMLKQFFNATKSFERATKCGPKNVDVWYDWINMEDTIRKRRNFALTIADRALEATNHDVSIFVLMLKTLKVLRDLDTLRNKAREKIEFYNERKRTEDVLRLLRELEDIERSLVNSSQCEEYILVVNQLIEKEELIERQISILGRAKELLERYGCAEEEINEFKKKANDLKRNRVDNVDESVNDMYRLFREGDFKKAEKTANLILAYAAHRREKKKSAIDALRILFKIRENNKEYSRIISKFEEYKTLAEEDDICKRIYKTANSSIEEEDKNNMINKISYNLQNSEDKMREIIMWSLESNEGKLLNLLRKERKPNWAEKWKNNRTRAEKKDLGIIYYSSFSELKQVFIFCKNEIVNCTSNQNRKFVNYTCKQITACFQLLPIIENRNELSHGRLLKSSIEDLRNICQHTDLLITLVSELSKAIINTIDSH